MSYTFISETHPVAKKEHTCIWCGEKILVNEKYTYRVGNFCGDFQYDHFHYLCNLAMLEDFKTSDEDEFRPYENKRATTKE